MNNNYILMTKIYDQLFDFRHKNLINYRKFANHH